MSETWHALTRQELFERLSSGEAGIDPATIDSRRQTYGENVLPERPSPSLLSRFLDQMRGALVLILLAAVVLSFAIGDWVEGLVILAIVLLNAWVGTMQERRAERALEALRDLSSPEATIIRGGKVQTVPTRALVVGDLVLLDAGTVVSADLRLIESARLQIDESSLTGESVPASKDADAVVPAGAMLGDRTTCAFMGTTVAYGRGKGVVIGVGSSSQLGQIAESLDEPDDDETPLQRRLNEFGRVMGWAVIGVCILIFLVGLMRDPSRTILLRDGWAAYLSGGRDVFLGLLIVAISLAVAAVPEGLTAVVTMGLALGTREMLKRNALVRRLPSVETLGSATIICTDKTGTLTRNQMTVTRLHSAGREYEVEGAGYTPAGEIRLEGKAIVAAEHPALRELLWTASVCNDARLVPDDDSGVSVIGDPTEAALLVAAAKAGLPWNGTPELRRSELPFDSKRKRMTVILSDDPDHPIRVGNGRYLALVKGAPDEVLSICSCVRQADGVVDLSDEMRHDLLERNGMYAGDGLRVLGVATREMAEEEIAGEAERIERDLVFLGLIAMHDPPRLEVRDAVDRARRAGLRTVMITGDHVATASAIGRQIGILRSEGEALSGADLDRMEDSELVARAETIDVFARVSPRHKVRIVEALQARGHVVAMTGDGVNDAPALKRADIGVAMGITGTDVAKQTADMVLTDDNYASIVDAVEQGRVIYANIRKTVFYLLSCNVAEIAILFVATLLGWPLPLTAIQLLWLNLVTDGAPALALGVEHAEPGIMSRPPRSATERMVDRRMAGRILFQSGVLAGVVLAVFGIALRTSSVALAGTLAFVTLVASELMRVYSARSETTPLRRLGMLGNRWMQLAVGSSFALILLVMYVPGLNGAFDVVPLRLGPWGVALVCGAIPALAMEIRKAWVSRRRA